MKKLMILLGAVSLLAVTTYAQTQKTNRTRTRSHDRSDVIKDTTEMKDINKVDKANHETDADRNNTNPNTSPKKTDTNKHK